MVNEMLSALGIRPDARPGAWTDDPWLRSLTLWVGSVVFVVVRCMLAGSWMLGLAILVASKCFGEVTTSVAEAVLQELLAELLLLDGDLSADHLHVLVGHLTHRIHHDEQCVELFVL